MSEHLEPILNFEFVPVQEKLPTVSRSLATTLRIEKNDVQVVYIFRIIGFGFKRIRKDQLQDIMHALHNRGVYKHTSKIVSFVEVDYQEINRVQSTINPTTKMIKKDDRGMNHSFDYFI